uniref:hypothetical protein n=1 Tax=Amycolatopsis sp. CA-096443 TaxID=3239919 RepID=UPI003F4935FA
MRLRDAVQDDRGHWRAGDGQAREVSEKWLRSACRWEPPPPEPPDPRIARLARLLDELLAGYAAAAAGTAPTPGQVEQVSADIRAALADVEDFLARDRRRRHGAARVAANAAFDRGRRAR